MRFFYFLLLFFLPIALFASEVPGRIVLVASGRSIHGNLLKPAKINKQEAFTVIPEKTLFTSEDIHFPGEKKSILDYKGENIIRRAEIIFFGALTFASFAGWLGISGYNMVMGASTFGTLKRYQFMTLFIGSGVVGFAVSLSDILLRMKPYMKNVTVDY